MNKDFDYGKGRPYYNKQFRDKVENRFYVYIYYRKSDNKPFYVGKGSASRAWSTGSRNDHWRSVANKHGYYFQILFDDLSEQESFDCEVDAIKELLYFGYNLTNKTDGGESGSGRVFSEETRLKMSIAQKTSEKVKTARAINSSKSKGRKATLETRQKLSKSLSGKVKTEEHILSVTEARRIKTIYTFKHLNGEIFTGTRYDFSLYSNLHRKTVSLLFGSNPSKTTKGWSLHQQ